MGAGSVTPYQIEAAASVLGTAAERDAGLGTRSTYRVGGRAALLVDDPDVDDLVLVARAVAASGLATLVIGRGSNLLVCDEGFPGIVVALGPKLSAVTVEGTTLRAGGGLSLPVLARRTAREGLTGFEWAVGVPGSVGGAVRMNAGGHGAEMADSLQTIRAVDLAGGEDGAVPVTIPAADLDLRYRSSNVSASQVVVEAELGLAVGHREESETQISEIVRWRRANQPGGPNAGSVFTNPEGDSAGRLIDAAGLKGHRVGSAAVSERHANFIQADSGGRSSDVFDLMVEVATRVEEVHGVALHPETRMVGFEWPDPSRAGE